ncbi:response regulator transcription factor [Geitlerinema calcuttense NRMC-F 0142]|uniref:Response regulator transcription factor n=2 Tax=Geitlerinema TaxID=63132 RepID=A0ABT7M386_9CYAN|nr:response regulator transcription factor [Geitlerinema calcuttense NRMC-F 0142]
MLVDDHPVFRNGLKTLITSDPDFEVVAETDNTSEAFGLYESLKPDICVVDVTLKDSSGLDLVKTIRDRHSDAKILVLSMHSEDFYAERALKAGAKGYVMKEQASEDIINALRAIAKDQIYLSQRMMNRLFSKTYGQKKDLSLSPIDSLTDRELEVLQMISDGKSVKEIAFALGLSHKTVETHRSHIMHKLGIGTSNELLQFAIHWKIDHQAKNA